MSVELGSTKVHPAKIKKVVRLYQEERLGVPEISRRTNLAQSTVYKLLDREGIERSFETRSINRKGRRRFTDEQEQQIVREYKEGMSLSILGEKWGSHSVTICNILKRHDIARRRKGNVFRAFSPEQVSEILRRYKAGESQTQIGQSLDCGQVLISRLLRANGISGGRRKERHWRWKGGRVKAGDYDTVLVDVSSPFASMRNTMGYVSEHRLIMAQHLGRPLTKTESVHHINGNKTDNRLENLQLRSGKHGSGVAVRCADCGSTNLIYNSLH